MWLEYFKQLFLDNIVEDQILDQNKDFEVLNHRHCQGAVDRVYAINPK